MLIFKFQRFDESAKNVLELDYLEEACRLVCLQVSELLHEALRYSL